MTVHYELILLYSMGIRPKEAINIYGYSRGSAYRFYRIYRQARKRAIEIISHRNSVSPAERSRVNNQGAAKRKKSVPSKEKWETEIQENGIVISRKVKNEDE